MRPILKLDKDSCVYVYILFSTLGNEREISAERNENEGIGIDKRGNRRSS